MSGIAGDATVSLDAAERATLGAIADQLIPAAHGMPSAAGRCRTAMRPPSAHCVRAPSGPRLAL